MGSGKGGGGGGRDAFPGSVGEAQALSDIQEAALNRALQRSAEFNFFDVTTPFGRRTFRGRPGSENFRQIDQLDPFGQDLRRLGRQQLRRFDDAFRSPIGGRDLLQNAANVEQATFDRGLALLEPVFERQSDRLENQLVQRGIPRSSTAFGEEFRTRIEDPRERALENLALSSVGAGRAEQSRAIEADLARRSGMMQELGFFGGGGLRQPQFQPTPQLAAQAPDVLSSFGLMNQNINARNALSQQGRSDFLGGLFGLGAAGISAFPFF